MIVRKSTERGRSQWGWLDSRHTFSFGDYYDPAWMGFRGLRVINDDRVAGGGGFGAHPHRDMEIVSYVLSGALSHKDSIGTGSVIRPGEVQRMSAGTGIVHSEFNASADEPVHFLQIWLPPRERGLRPSYAQAPTGMDQNPNRWALLAAESGEAAVSWSADAALFGATLQAGARVELPAAEPRFRWIHVAKGSAKLGELELAEGDGAGFEAAQNPPLISGDGAEVLLFALR